VAVQRSLVLIGPSHVETDVWGAVGINHRVILNEVKNLEVKNLEVKNLEVKNLEVKNLEVKNLEVKNLPRWRFFTPLRSVQNDA
jgi:hypothetical protein